MTENQEYKVCHKTFVIKGSRFSFDSSSFEVRDGAGNKLVTLDFCSWESLEDLAHLLLAAVQEQQR